MNRDNDPPKQPPEKAKGQIPPLKFGPSDAAVESGETDQSNIGRAPSESQQVVKGRILIVDDGLQLPGDGCLIAVAFGCNSRGVTVAKAMLFDAGTPMNWPACRFIGDARLLGAFAEVEQAREYAAFDAYHAVKGAAHGR